MEKLKVLFICKDSAVRSQLAAAFLNTYFGGRYEAYYAGIEPVELNQQAAKVMKEAGIDISSCRPRKIEDLRCNKFDCIITLCDFALGHLPTLPEHKKRLHHGFKDFCIPELCENATKFKMCFPEQKKTHKRGYYDTKEINLRLPRAKARGLLRVDTEPPSSPPLRAGFSSGERIKGGDLLPFRYLREAIFYWVENEMVF